MFEEVFKGIEFEQEFAERLWHIFGNELHEPMHLNCKLMPESGRVAAKDGWQFGDVIFRTDHSVGFIDCTSTWVRNDHKMVTRVRTKDKKLDEMLAFTQRLTQHLDYHPSIDKKIPKEILLKYHNFRQTVYKYLDKTFGMSSKMIVSTDNPDVTDKDIRELITSKGDFDNEAYWKKYGVEYGVSITYDRGYWWGADRFYGAIAFEYADELFVTVLNKDTIPILSKADPNVAEVIPVSFTLYGFALWLICDNFVNETLGNLDCDLEYVKKLLDDQDRKWAIEDGTYDEYLEMKDVQSLRHPG